MPARLLSWSMTCFGGLLLGAGSVLHGQVALARLGRQEADATFFLWRAIGHATFDLQGCDNRFGLAMEQVSEEVLSDMATAAWVLVSVGILVSIAALLMPAPSRRSQGPARARARAAR